MPVALTLKETVVPGQADWLTGCVVVGGGLADRMVGRQAETPTAISDGRWKMENGFSRPPVEDWPSMDVKVKICGITSAEDARMAAEAGADAVGLMFYERSSRFVSLETAEGIVAPLSPFVMRVGVFVNPEPELVHAAIARCGLNLLQFHGEESPEFCVQFGVMSMKAFRMRDENSLSELARFTTDAYLLDSFVAGQRGGSGERFNWDLAVAAKRFGKPIFLAGGLTPENVAEAVQTVAPFAVDVSSGVELAPGKKCAEKIRAFIRAAKSI
jgi:phosphoribosylanthranilate isomerase